jgi:uncharacterized protein YraI
VETREIQALGHSYGEWKTVTEPTVSTEGLRERQCSVCGSKQTEAIPVLDTIERVYATITSSMVDVLADAHTGSAQTGELYTGVVVEILEQKTVGQQVWGRIEFGWICLTGNTTLETVEEEPGEDTGDKTYIYLENSGLSIRPAPQTYYTRVGILRQGVRVRVYEISVLGGETWARTAYGWVWVTVNIKLETQPGQHTEHTYGQWYTVQAGTCMAAAQERRNCTVCDHYETREGQLGDHSFGQWVVTKEATTAQAGLERRDCDLCDHYEEREIEKLPERIQKVYGWYIDTDYLSIRQGPGTSYERVGWLAPHVQVEILEQTDVNGVVWGRIEQGWVCVTGYIKVVCADIPASSLYATITATQVSIYKGVGTTFETVGTLQKGKSVEVLATVTENGQQWGYTASGWICLTGNATLSDKPASDTADTPNLNFSTGVEDSWFDDALFIGDSRFCGLQAFARSGNATYFCDVGMTVFNYSGKVLSDNSYTNLSLEQLLSSRKFGKIIFNFGLNEAGYVSWYFISKYQELVDMVRSLQPDAILILNGIMSVTESKAAQGDYFSPSHLAELSEKIEAMCDGKTIFYIDCNPYFADANGYLYTELASDGYHPTVYAYRKWRDWIAFAVKQLGL